MKKACLYKHTFSNSFVPESKNSFPKDELEKSDNKLRKLVFATNNQNKFIEVKNLFNNLKNLELLSLNDINFKENIPEDFDTIEQNAMYKADVIHKFCGLNVISDDTALEVDYLNGKPGVFSARYAGVNCSSVENINKLLNELNNIANRKASFRTVAALIFENQMYTFEGKIDGEILTVLHGSGGFGYDPIFQPLGHSMSFAQMNLSLKNQISHRALAFKKLLEFLQTK